MPEKVYFGSSTFLSLHAAGRPGVRPLHALHTLADLLRVPPIQSSMESVHGLRQAAQG